MTPALLLTVAVAASAAGQDGRIAPRPPEVACPTIAPIEDAWTMVAGAYDGAAIADSWVGDPEDVTHVIDVRLLPGRPLHLVLTASAPMIYRVSGDTGRLRRITVAGRKPSGVVGVQRGLVRFIPDCIPYEIHGGAKPMITRAAAVLGGLHATGGGHEVAELVIGDDVRAVPGVRKPVSDPLQYEVLRFFPGGVIAIPSARVVSAVPVGRYAVLPSSAGLVALLRSGALVPATRADAELWLDRHAAHAPAPGTDPRSIRKTAPHGANFGTFRVTRPISMPPGLHGAHSAQFYGPRDWLSGDPGHSELFFDDGSFSGPFNRPTRD